MYIIIWFTKSGNVSIAVDNYEIGYERVIKNGIEVMKLTYQKDGTVDYYDFGPLEIQQDPLSFDKTVNGNVSELKNISKELIMSDGGFMGKDPIFDTNTSEGYKKQLAGGLVKLYSDYTTDIAIKSNLNLQYELQDEIDENTMELKFHPYNPTS